MKFVNETCAIISPTRDIIHLIKGGYSVEAHSKLLWRLHEHHPGIIYCIAHTHPPGMTELSIEDQTTLRAQAMAMTPFPVRIATVTLVEEHLFKTSIYLGLYESAEEYVANNRTGKRNFEIFLEKENFFFNPKLIPFLAQEEYISLLNKVKGGHMKTWEKIITERSYIMEENV